MSIRVRDLAKELSKTNKEIIEALNAKGIEGKTQASNLENAQVSAVKEYFTSNNSDSKKENHGNKSGGNGANRNNKRQNNGGNRDNNGGGNA